MKFLFVCSEYAEKTPWRDEFDKFINEISAFASVIVISSGVRDVCFAKLSDINFPRSNVLGAEFLVDEKTGLISGNRTIVSDVGKGKIVEKLQNDGRNIIAVGHSEGDRAMIDAANFGIAYCQDDEFKNDALNIDELRALIYGYFGGILSNKCF